MGWNSYLMAFHNTQRLVGGQHRQGRYGGRMGNKMQVTNHP